MLKTYHFLMRGFGKIADQLPVALSLTVCHRATLQTEFLCKEGKRRLCACLNRVKFFNSLKPELNYGLVVKLVFRV